MTIEQIEQEINNIRERTSEIIERFAKISVVHLGDEMSVVLGELDDLVEKIERTKEDNPEPKTPTSSTEFGTKVRVRDAGDENWREAKFLDFTYEDDEYPFYAYVNDSTQASGWKRCEICAE